MGEAAISRGVKVRLLASHWDHTRPAMIRYASSLDALSGDNPHVDIQVKLFTVPAFTPEQKKIPFARVNHNKCMVTDKTGFIEPPTGLEIISFQLVELVSFTLVILE